MSDEITVDDIQIGATADIRWNKGKFSEIYPAVLQKSRVQKGNGVIQYLVHYKNWNKRYDEWVLLDNVMRIYDEAGQLLKSRVVENVDIDATIQPTIHDQSDDSPDDRPLKPRRNQPRKPSKNYDEDDDEHEDEDDDDEKSTVRRNPRRGPVKKNSSVLDIDFDSDEEEEEHSPVEATNPETRSCAAGCGKDAQPESIYCSVECIMAHAKKVQPEPAVKKPEEESPPPLEDVDDGDLPEGEESDEDFVPAADKKVKKEKPTKIRVKKGDKKPTTPVKQPKAIKRLSPDDIDKIMRDVEDMKDTEPIMVMKNGALLTGYAAPRKSNLRKFLEENLVGVKVVLGKKSHNDGKKTFDPNGMMLSRAHNDRRHLDKVKRDKELKFHPQKPVAKVAPNFKGDVTTNPYARAENRQIKKDKKDESKKDKKRRVSDRGDKVVDKTKRKGEVDNETRALMQSIKSAQKRGIMTGTSALKPKPEGKPELKKRLSMDGERKRTSSETNSSLETPPKKRRDSDGFGRSQVVPEKNDRSLIRRKLRETLTGRSQNSGNDDSEKLQMDTNSIAKLVGKIEKHMFEKFTDVNKEYKTKFRMIHFNLQDKNNDYFWRRVIQGEISASTLHKMTSNEMSSMEKMEWRQQQHTNELDQIKKIEEIKQKEALKPTAKITHKGEIEIEHQMFDDGDRTMNEFNASVNEESNEDKVKDSDGKASDDEPATKKDTSISQAEKETINRIISKRNVTESLSSAEMDVSEPVADSGEMGGDSPKTPDYVYNPESPEGPVSDGEDFVSQSPPTPPPMKMDEDKPVEDVIMKSADDNIMPLSKVWSGKLIFPEASTFKANAYVISGQVSNNALKQSIPKNMTVAGRLDYKTVGDYIDNIRHGSDASRICILSLYGVSSAEETGYINSLTYLSERNKVGVVKSESNSAPLKDVYLIALQEDEKPPSWISPMDGAGLPDDHPAIILALLVKKSEKVKRGSDKEIKKISRNVAAVDKRDPETYDAPDVARETDGQSLPHQPIQISDDVFNSLKEAVTNVTPSINPPKYQPNQWSEQPDDRHRDSYYEGTRPPFPRDEYDQNGDRGGWEQQQQQRDASVGHYRGNSGPRGRGGGGSSYRSGGGRRPSGEGWNNRQDDYYEQGRNYHEDRDRDHHHRANHRGYKSGRRRDY